MSCICGACSSVCQTAVLSQAYCARLHDEAVSALRNSDLRTGQTDSARAENVAWPHISCLECCGRVLYPSLALRPACTISQTRKRRETWRACMLWRLTRIPELRTRGPPMAVSEIRSYHPHSKRALIGEGCSHDRELNHAFEHRRGLAAHSRCVRRRQRKFRR